MKKHLLINRNILYVYGFYLLTVFLLVLSVLITGKDLNPNGDIATVYNMVTIVLYSSIVVMMFMIPAIIENNDNKYIYMNVPKTRLEILKDRYKVNFTLLGITVLVAFITVNLIVLSFSHNHLNGLIEYGGLYENVGINLLLGLLYLIVLNKFVFTMNSFRQLSPLKHSKLILGTASIVFVLLQFYMIIVLGFTDSITHPYILYPYILQIVLAIGMVYVDVWVFKRGEV